MKKFLIFALIVSVTFVSCKNEKPKEVETPVSENKGEAIADGTYTVTNENSILNWKGFKPTGTHNGTVAIKDGNLVVSDGKLTGGNFTFDMNSIVVLDIPADDEYNAKLVGHLKNSDFFDVENNPTVMFKITEVLHEGTTLVKGDLTIKGITKSIEFPVSLNKTTDGVELVGNAFKIDRTEYNIQYKSQKFFDDLKDKFINDEFEISFKVNASK
ncbi:YceI family protein [Lutibacter maritimus]|jgi:polyisoprenoid-binding protein YceI|uniref:Polyisoprenoid-binding protein YceI n=1 Tax=Lutibacter maritimus TaxID=593133 RepID=A0A1I6Q1Y1_9FLAO|nr:YceI family protein [Lutibacter maritimus]SFS46433.1 Polyisoprenoid-binding protein YceI [Lutibacter maritimus]